MTRYHLCCRFHILQFAICIFQFAIAARVSAAESEQVRSPLSPQESLKHLVVQDNLTVELAACEPNVIDPVEVRFDENGRMWVVEMRDYPMTEITGDDVYSTIKVLDDTDGDGFYETVAVVADDLRYATGLQPWKGGAFVTMAGKVAYLKDITGDDKADVVETWYTGFAEDNQQLRANHPRLALDNQIYIAGGLRGGKIVNARKPDAKPVSISGMDFRFDPVTAECEAVSGPGQFGLTFDDYGNRFVCSNRNPAMHVIFENDELRKNPLVAVPALMHDVARPGDESRVFPITTSWTTSNLHAGQFTAACGVEIYRGDALGEQFRGNLFVCEPTGHLVHREIIRPNGVTFEAESPYDGVEFLASRDPWFSPVNLEVGPDGALYVVDMYRAVIEHPDWVPVELKRRRDELWGNDRGRIYRIVPKGFKRTPRPNLSEASSDVLVDLQSHLNAWHRETAARLLLERQDQSIGPQLKKAAMSGDSSLARIHALWLLHGLDLLDGNTLLAALNDDPRVAEQIFRVAAMNSELRLPADLLTNYADADDPRVRSRAVLAMQPGYARLPSAHKADVWEMYARLIAAGRHAGELLRDLPRVKASMSDPRRFVSEAARLAAASGDEQIDKAIVGLTDDEELGRVGLASLLNEASRRGIGFDEIRSRIASKAQHQLDRMIDVARADAVNVEASVADRCDAIDLLAATGEDTELLTELAVNDAGQPVRLRAIVGLTNHADDDSWRTLLSLYQQATPSIQRAVLDGVFARSERINLLLDAVEAGEIRATELDANYATRLLNHSDTTIKARATQLLAAAIPADREKVLAEYQLALTLPSSPVRGRAIFEKNCATCHQIDDIGTTVAPDISDSRLRLPAQLLTDILQPNRAIDSNYFSYTVITTEGLTHTGILSAETPTSVTLKQAEGKTIMLTRSEIDELRSDGVSFMPDGLEKNIPPQEMADLISFIKNWRYLKEGAAAGR